MTDGNTSKRYHCTLCDYSNTRLHDFTDHMITHSEIYPHGCNKCTFRFASTTLLHSHVQQVHAMKPISIRAKEAVVHVKPSAQWHVFECPVCDYKGYRIDSFKKHATEHTGLFKYNCIICTVPFHYGFQMEKHLVRKHQQEKAEAQANIATCENEQWFSATAKLYRDVSNFKIEPSEKQSKTEVSSITQTYTCEECGIKFASKLRYTSHVFDNHSKADATQEDVGTKSGEAKKGVDLNFNSEVDLKPPDLKIGQVYSASDLSPTDSWPFGNHVLDFSN